MCKLFIVTFLDWWGNPIWSSLIKFDPFWTDLIQKNQKSNGHFYSFLKMWQLCIVTFFDWWEIQFGQVWSSLIHFGRIWSKKIKNKTAIFILFKNVTTFHTDIFWYVQPLRSFFFGQTEGRKDGNRTDIVAQIVV